MERTAYDSAHVSMMRRGSDLLLEAIERHATGKPLVIHHPARFLPPEANERGAGDMPRSKARQPPKTQPNERECMFAELLAEGVSIPLIRQRMGMSEGAAQSMMTRIKTRLGWQAI